MTYTLNSDTCVIRDTDGAFIPLVDGNADYHVYQTWLAEGNTPNVAPVVTPNYPALAKEALDASDLVALRCFKANVAFPVAWQTYVTALRAIVSGAAGPLPIQPNYPTN